MLNLVRNAFEAMEQAGRSGLRIVSRSAESGMIEVSVIDNGPGLPEEVAARVFQPFFTTKRHGMGVGLAISRTIIEGHGGKIWVEPNPEGGTIFKFTLPLAPEADR
jgi:two-component system sensor kinase FixL